MKRQKKKKIRFKGVIIVLLVSYLIIMIGYYFFKIPIKNIKIDNNNLVSEKEIIDVLNISEKTSLFKVNSYKVIKNLKKNIPLVKDAKIKKSFNGKLTITVEENKLLFFDVLNNELVLSNGKRINDDNKYTGFPYLINYTPSEILDNFIKGFANIDDDIISMISEIEYSPDRYNDTILDDERFVLRMNDGNIVYVNIVNIKKLNQYQTIFATVGGDGILYLDSSSKNYIYKTKDSINEENDSNLQTTDEANN